MGVLSRAVKKMVGKRSGRITKSWDYDSRASLLAAPAIADIDNDGKPEIIIATKNGEVIVLNSESQKIWVYSVKEEIGAVEEMFLDEEIINSINSTPAIADITGDGKSNIIFGTEMGVLYCLDESGKLVWKFKTKGGVRGSPVVADVNNDGRPEIIFGTTDKYLYIITNNGELIDKYEQDSPIESTPGFFRDQIIFGTDDGTIISLTAKGEENWRHKTDGKITAEPAFGKLGQKKEDYVVIGSTDNNLYCFDIHGELAWVYETNGAIYSKATLADLNGNGKLDIVIGSCDNNIHALTCDGERYWTYETDFWVVGSPIVADIDGDGRLEVIAGSYDHNIYILDSEGSYVLDYVPGLSGVVQQPGHYSEIMTQEPGQNVGKKIWQFKSEGVVIGCSALSNDKKLVLGTKIGIIDELQHHE